MRLIKVIIILPTVFVGCFFGLFFEAFKIGFVWGRDAIQVLGDECGKEVADWKRAKANTKV